MYVTTQLLSFNQKLKKHIYIFLQISIATQVIYLLLNVKHFVINFVSILAKKKVNTYYKKKIVGATIFLLVVSLKTLKI